MTVRQRIEVNLDAYQISLYWSQTTTARFGAKTPLTRRTRDVWDVCRARVWAGSLMAVAGTRRMDEIGFRISSKLELEVFEFSRLKKYAQGTCNPSASNRPGCSGPWIEWAEAVFQGTRAWYLTPFWSLFQSRRSSAEELWECVHLLPNAMQVPLVETQNLEVPAELRLGVVPRSCIYELTEQINPWTLGALACAMRRAEISGNLASLRWAGVAMLWTLDQLSGTAAPMLKDRLSELRQLLGETLDSIIYPIGSGALHPIAAEEVQRFARERDAYERLFAKQAVVDWDLNSSPPWVESTPLATPGFELPTRR